jgi:hypothetical protein
MKVSINANFTINDEVNPTDVRFSSGTKTFQDSSSYAECESSTFALAVGDTDIDLPLGSLQDVAMMYFFAKAAGVKIKVYVTSVEEAPSEMELIPNVPCILPVKAKRATVSNTGGSATSLVYAAVGN